jgi:hypothetical protein
MAIRESWGESFPFSILKLIEGGANQTADFSARVKSRQSFDFPMFRWRHSEQNGL